ncbi:MAG: nitrile hydratase accessory protein [Rubrivivax sp.]|nr:nitrile hydratase accessory protein [Rubrivivax sp.]
MTPGVEQALRLVEGAEPAVFRAPWEAHAFAMTLSLHRAGLFTWNEWATSLAACIRQAQTQGDPDLGDTYYQHWLAALERLVVEKGAGSAHELHRTGQAWAHAAGRTPHGRPIELTPADYGAA